MASGGMGAPARTTRGWTGGSGGRWAGRSSPWPGMEESMQRIGIVGGLGPESTLEYYKGVIAAFAVAGGYQYPEMVIVSLNLGQVLAMFEAGAWDDLADLLVAACEDLARAGADFGAIASNTPHLVFDQVRERSPLPLVSIVDACARRARDLGLARPGLLATGVTMGSSLYQDVFAPLGMAVVAPSPQERELINRRLFSEIELGVIKDSTRRELLAVVEDMKRREGIDSVILGCTELPLILDRGEYLGIPFLNTTAIHVAAIVERCRQG